MQKYERIKEIELLLESDISKAKRVELLLEQNKLYFKVIVESYNKKLDDLKKKIAN